MKIQHVSFVSAAELFEDCKDVWDRFVDRTSDMSWGDNEHSLVDTKGVIGIIKDMLEDEDVNLPEVERILGRISLLPDGTFIDLET